MVRRVHIGRSALDALLAYGKMNHPREGILLLRGLVKSGEAFVRELVVPPMALHGEGFSGFQPYLLPIDASIIGVAHTHPSSDPRPSRQDLLSFMGAVGLIAAYPYEGPSDVLAFDHRGQLLPLEIHEEE